MTTADYFPPAWLADAAELDKARRAELADLVVFLSEERFKRETGVNAEVFAYGLSSFDATAVMLDDGFYRIAIPGGRKPDVLDRHLKRIAPHLHFRATLPGSDETDETETGAAD